MIQRSLSSVSCYDPSAGGGELAERLAWLMIVNNTLALIFILIFLLGF